jgi:hypothetical protein
MTRFLVELARPDSGWREIRELSDRSRAAARQLGQEGLDVRCLRSIFVPEDDVCFLLYEAESEEVVSAAASLAGLGVLGVAEAIRVVQD